MDQKDNAHSTILCIFIYANSFLYYQCLPIILLIDDTIINTDQEKIEKVLSSMVRNAIKYTRKGNIKFGYDIRTNGNPIDPPELQFYVKDTGIGIPKERQ